MGKGAIPNDRLRAAREARGWSRAELARRVAAHLQGDAGVDENHVGRWERGDVRQPRTRYRAALRAVLGALDDAALGFGPTWATIGTGSSGGEALRMEDMDRRQLLQGTVALALTPPAGNALGALAPDPAPARVGASEIEQVRIAASAVSSLSFAQGGDFAVRAGLGQLHWAHGLLSARCPDRLRPDLFAAVSRLANACGFAAFDAMQLDRARRLLDLAAAYAVEAEEPGLLASALGDMALISLWEGDPLAALTRAERGLAEADRLPSTGRAMLLATAARAHGQMGDRAATERHVGLADDAFAGPAQDDDWLDYYDDNEHAGTTAHALYDLTLATGELANGATERHRQAVDGHGDAYARSRMLAQARLAAVTMEAGDPDEAAGIGVDALAATTSVRSGRTAGYLRTLHRVSAPHAQRPAVAEMRSRIADTVLA